MQARKSGGVTRADGEIDAKLRFTRSGPLETLSANERSVDIAIDHILRPKGLKIVEIA